MASVEQSRRVANGDPGAEANPSQVERWTRVKALFLEALQHPDSERSAFVALASAGDEELRKELDSLLASEKAAASFCESPAAELIGSAGVPAPEMAPRLSAGTRLGAYEITGFIAAGGMGAVYRARHALLGREVAIKTIGQGVGLADASARRRLIREAQHASTLTHPNICAIHDVGDADDVPFIVMAYVNGRSLRDLVGERVLSIPDALHYGAQIARALEHAHGRGIIHRDLKSSNVVIGANGEAIVLDFGLARRLPDDAATPSRELTLTHPDALAGTLSHMSPEVLRGERADTRSDVWALGVLLYELVMGELPFTGRTQFETSKAILSDAPKPMNPRVPLALRLVIEHCLIKDPAGRYQRAHLVAAALDAIKRRRAWPVVGRLLVSARRDTVYAAAAAALLLPVLLVAGSRMRAQFGATFSRRISTLALMPLENATGDPRADYFAEGITDALITQLGAATDVRVLSRAPAARAATMVTGVGSNRAPDVIVRGALRRSSERITLSLRLIRPSDGSVLWSETFVRPAREVLALEGDVVRALAGAIQLTLKPQTRERLAAIRAVSPDVYEAYLKGRYEWNKRTPASLQLAVQHLTRAVELDPTYAPAHAALADCFNQLRTVLVGSGSPLEYRPLAAAEAIKALQIDPYSAEAHAALGYVWHYEWRWADAERELRRAIELNPSYSLARIWYGNLLMSRLRMKEALDQVTAGLELDPFSLVVNTNVGWILDGAGRHEDAIVQLRKTLALDSTYVQARSRLAGALASAGHFTEALDEANRLVTLSDSSLSALALRTAIIARAGRRDEARALLDQLRLRSDRQYLPPVLIARVFVALGDADSTLIWLEKAFAEKSNAIAYLALDYQNEPLRHDPRFQTLLARAGLK